MNICRTFDTNNLNGIIKDYFVELSNVTYNEKGNKSEKVEPTHLIYIF